MVLLSNDNSGPIKRHHILKCLDKKKAFTALMNEEILKETQILLEEPLVDSSNSSLHIQPVTLNISFRQASVYWAATYSSNVVCIGRRATSSVPSTSGYPNSRIIVMKFSA